MYSPFSFKLIKLSFANIIYRFLTFSELLCTNSSTAQHYSMQLFLHSTSQIVSKLSQNLLCEYTWNIRSLVSLNCFHRYVSVIHIMDKWPKKVHLNTYRRVVGFFQITELLLKPTNLQREIGFAGSDKITSLSCQACSVCSFLENKIKMGGSNSD